MLDIWEGKVWETTGDDWNSKFQREGAGNKTVHGATIRMDC